MSYSTTSYPYDTVVYITDMIGGEYFQGSGVLISPDEVLTASHVVYSQGVGTASDITVIPGYEDGAAPYGVYSGTSIHYNPVDDAGDLISTDQTQYDYAVIHLSSPVIGVGTMGLLPNLDGQPLDGVHVTGYPASAFGTQINSTQVVILNPTYNVLDGTALGPGSSGGPVWVESGGQADVVGLVSSGDGSIGYDSLITSAALATIDGWMAQDDRTLNANQGLAILDTTNNTSLTGAIQSYTGPVSGVQHQYVNLTADSLNISATTPNWFIHSGSGNDAIVASSGTNVLDGGTGSNFLTGGSGTDTFFVDDRATTADIWSTVDNFHAGDAVTVWGVTPQDFALAWVNGQGAAGYTGLTLHATASGEPNASLTLVGFSSRDLTDGRLTVSFGTTSASGGVPGSTYMNIHDNI